MPASPNEVTELLVKWSTGDKAALDELMPIIHSELRRLARRYMARERSGPTLQTTALINEVYWLHTEIGRQDPWTEKVWPDFSLNSQRLRLRH